MDPPSFAAKGSTNDGLSKDRLTGFMSISRFVHKFVQTIMTDKLIKKMAIGCNAHDLLSQKSKIEGKTL